MHKPSKIKFPVDLSKHELELIRDKTFFDPDLILSALANNNYCLNLTLDQINDLAGWVAAEANHAKSARLEEKLGDLYDKLDSLSYECSRQGNSN